MTAAEDVERAVRVSGPAIVTLRWVCRAWITQKGTWFGHSCGGTTTTQSTREARDSYTAQAECPECGRTMNSRDDGCEVVS